MHPNKERAHGGRQATSSGYLERPRPSGLADVIEVILDKGLVIDAYVRVSLIGIEILTIDARIVIASVDTYLRFAEAVGRLNIAEADDSQGLPELMESMTSGRREVEDAGRARGREGEAHRRRRRRRRGGEGEEPSRSSRAAARRAARRREVLVVGPARPRRGSAGSAALVVEQERRRQRLRLRRPARRQTPRGLPARAWRARRCGRSSTTALAAIVSDLDDSSLVAAREVRAHWRVVEARRRSRDRAAGTLRHRPAQRRRGRRAAARPQAERLSSLLEELDGRVQLAVKGEYDEELLLREIVERDPGGAALNSERVLALPEGGRLLRPHPARRGSSPRRWTAAARRDSGRRSTARATGGGSRWRTMSALANGAFDLAFLVAREHIDAFGAPVARPRRGARGARRAPLRGAAAALQLCRRWTWRPVVPTWA